MNAEAVHCLNGLHHTQYSLILQWISELCALTFRTQSEFCFSTSNELPVAPFSSSNTLHRLDWPWIRTYIQIENKQKILCFISIIIVIILYIRAISTTDIERTLIVDKRPFATTLWQNREIYIFGTIRKTRKKACTVNFKLNATLMTDDSSQW